MKNISSTVLFISAALVGSLPLAAQQPAQKGPAPRTSPHETISQTFDGKRDNRVVVIYGRPYSKDPKSGDIRQIWGGLVPYGKVWRMGSDEATTLLLQQPTILGGTEL